MNEKLNYLGIDVGKTKCRVAVKNDKGNILDEFFFGNDTIGISNLLYRVKTNGTHYTVAQAVLESIGNMWMRIYDTLEENGVDTVLPCGYWKEYLEEMDPMNSYHPVQD